MSDRKDDGGPAFPRASEQRGLTKREWYAAHAPEGEVMEVAKAFIKRKDDPDFSLFDARFFWADAMIEASKK